MQLLRHRIVWQSARGASAFAGKRPDLDLDISPDLIIGAITAAAKTAVLSERGPVDGDAMAERIADTLWHGLGDSRSWSAREKLMNRKE